MSKEIFMRLQTDMKNLGHYEGEVDGLWGGRSQAAWDAVVGAAKAVQLVDMPPSVQHVTTSSKIAWSAKVSEVFIDRVIWIADALQMPKTEGASWLMSCMAWESAETFRPDIKNMAGSGATGLIQFMPATAVGLGTTVEQLARKTAEDQLNYVYKYFLPYKGRLKNLGDTYLAILWPNGIGKDDSWALWDKDARPTTYRQNAGLDINKDGIITRGECIAKVMEKYNKGMQASFVR